MPTGSSRRSQPLPRKVAIFIAVAVPVATLLGAAWGGLTLLQGWQKWKADEQHQQRVWEAQQQERLNTAKELERQTAAANRERAIAEKERSRLESARSQSEMAAEERRWLVEANRREFEWSRQQEQWRREDEAALQGREIEKERQVLAAISALVSGDNDDSSAVVTLLQEAGDTERGDLVVEALLARLKTSGKVVETRLILEKLESEEYGQYYRPLAEVAEASWRRLERSLTAIVVGRLDLEKDIGTDGFCGALGSAIRSTGGRLNQEILSCVLVEDLLGESCSVLSTFSTPSDFDDYLRQRLDTDRMDTLRRLVGEARKGGLGFETADLSAEISHRVGVLLMAPCRLEPGEDCSVISLPGYRRDYVRYEAMHRDTFFVRVNSLAGVVTAGIGERSPTVRLRELCDEV